MKVIFFGTPHFAAKTLEKLIHERIDVVAVVTRPDKPQGRSRIPVASPVKKLALEHYLPVHQPEKASDPFFAPILEAYHADLFVVVAYGEIIKQHLLDMPKRGCINVHASLLPKYRGAAPIQHAIINGETETGITIIHMVKKMDAGDIITQRKVTIGPDLTSGELAELLIPIGSQCLLEVLAQFEQGNVTEKPQDENKATYAPKIELEDCEIDWSRSAQGIHNLVRGVNPRPGAWSFVSIRGEKKRMTIYKTHVLADIQASPGSMIKKENRPLTIACGEQGIEILQLQLEGKKEMSSQEFMRGMPKEHISFQKEG